MPSRKKQPAPKPEPIDTKALYDRDFADGQKDVIRRLRSHAQSNQKMHLELLAAEYPARAARCLRFSEDVFVIARIIELQIAPVNLLTPVQAQAWRISCERVGDKSESVK